VLFVDVEIPTEVTAPIQPVDEPAVATLKAAPVKVAKPTGEEAEAAPVATAPAVAPATLPTTASITPLVGILGLLALGGSLILGTCGRQPE
jgi:hypothetical protein